mmetsp:Transcript_33882/g.73871  ORF Transcript_33882/g.73871 Transcript_33882/m.73871 type:complete len:238 (-) Transcript_33882:1364-2077(-)
MLLYNILSDRNQSQNTSKSHSESHLQSLNMNMNQAQSKSALKKTQSQTKEDLIVGVHMLFSFLKSDTLCLLCRSMVDRIEQNKIPDDLKPWLKYYFEYFWRKGLNSAYSGKEDVVRFSLEFLNNKMSHYQQSYNFNKNRFNFKSICKSVNICDGELTKTQLTEYKSYIFKKSSVYRTDQINNNTNTKIPIKTNNLSTNIKFKENKLNLKQNIKINIERNENKKLKIGVLTDVHVDWQ